MKEKTPLYIFIVLVMAYAAIVFGTPPDPEVLQKYSLSESAARMLNFTVVGPLVAIWIIAFNGVVKIKNYARAVQDSKEGSALGKLSKGLTILVITLPLAASLGALLNNIADTHQNFLPTATILRNYINLLFPLLAFYFIGSGAAELANLVKKKSQILDPKLWTIGAIVLSSLFTWLVLSQYISGKAASSYYLPDWIVVLTLVIPYLYVWYRGVLAAFHIRYYRDKVRGALYKHALGYLSTGIGIVILVSILIQLFTVFSERVTRLNLTPLLLVLYALICCYVIGYGLIARGAKKLKMIEEV